MFSNEYLNLPYSDMDNLCRWVLNARGEYAEEAVVHHEATEFEGPVTKSTSSSSMSEKLWIAFGEVQLYEADRYNNIRDTSFPFFCSGLFLKAAIPG